MSYTRVCKTCGQEFESASSWRGYCDKCRKKRRCAATQRSRKRNYFTPLRKMSAEELAIEVKAEQDRELAYRKKYCAGYSQNEWECVSCFLNQVAQFKGCKR